MKRLLAASLSVSLFASQGYAQDSKPAQVPASDPTPAVSPEAGPTRVGSTDVIASRSWFGAEALGWWIRGQSLPALVTGSAIGTSLANAGLLGAPTTTVLAGDSRVGEDLRFGGRFTAGRWLNDAKTLGIGGEFFILSQGNDSSSFSSTGDPILARPFTVFPSGTPSAQIVAFPGLATGSVQTDASSDFLGAGLYAYRQLGDTCDSRVVAFAGYRYLRLGDEVNITEQVMATGRRAGGPPTGTGFQVADSFRTLNQFHGADLGLSGRMYRNRVFLDVSGRLGLGATVRSFGTEGFTILNVPGQASAMLPGGLLVPATGTSSSDCVFSFVPELRLNVGYQLTSHLEIFAGYNVMWWTNVIRAGEQIDLRVNPGLLPPPIATGPVPTAPFASSTFWAQGVNVGLIRRF